MSDLKEIILDAIMENDCEWLPDSMIESLIYGKINELDSKAMYDALEDLKREGKISSCTMYMMNDY